MDVSLSLKHLLFLSLQKHHIKQWEQLTKYNYFDDNQTCLANTLGAPKRIAA